MASEPTRLLMLIDDEPAQSRLVSALAAREGWRTLVVGSGEDALAKLVDTEGAAVRAVLLDQWVPGDAACELIREIRTLRPDVPLLMLTASTSPLLAVEAMRAGATDYLIKPVAPDRLLAALRSATRPEAPRDELQPMTEKLPHVLDFDAMVGTAAPFRTALAKAATAARNHGHVLVEGESGTGKEMLMRAMHAASTRAKTTMKLVGCGSIPATSLESLVFGHEKGAFAGAFDRQTGLLEHCDGGTLILDDIDRMDLLLQDRLADVIESGIVRPSGAQHGFRIDVRIFASSDLPLEELVAAGEFSERLFAALSATRIHMPALRDRMGDIPALTRYFLSQIGEQPGLIHHSIADSGLTLLEAYDWPGNVRQLQAVLFRASVFEQREALTAHSFPQLSQLLGDSPDRGESRARGLGVLLYLDDGNLRPLEEIEADIIRLAIGHYRGRMTEVARRLGIGRSTLYRKLSELGIDNAA
ncbi:sigma-54 dependent transcriptional regulator [Qipengyuania sp. 6B39]|uniref:sigma-54-dependent transcriptional regulator n=1 Tax=Qipengyuania proteolytica TaxID=2867239 RepID=UPI001C8906BB|nr:sigma-54 dependent transcriptional regulator [Qipengyuania proteolytica]MBX7495510.1 sigma-54 dependent transcriptional regulator [Qipengyuania proteolytica]